jgi:EAL domain-containing protein (putative c-di-GMP-specific phosphodiesterase class I)/GGDEF domain-containing protein
MPTLTYPQAVSRHLPSPERLVDQTALHAVFQPVIDLARGKVYGHESLIRGPRDSDIQFPDALFSLAKRQGRVVELERAAARVGAATYAAQRGTAKLFINFGASALLALARQNPVRPLASLLADTDIDTSQLVIELTEDDPGPGSDELSRVLRLLREQGAMLALDDFGNGYSSLRRWAELQPDIVKIDRYFARDVHLDARKMQALRALLDIAEAYGTRLVAEGIETADELGAVRDLGFHYAQGYFLDRPTPGVNHHLNGATLEVLEHRQVAVYPPSGPVAHNNHHVDALRVDAPPVLTSTTNDAVVALFHQTPALHAVCVVDTASRPLGLINRRDFMDRYTQPYHKELYGRRSCEPFMRADPILVERVQTLDEMTSLLLSGDQRYLTDGFVIVDDGRYLGLGTGEQLVRAVTEVRIEAARHANPLTFLPGNIPISAHIQRLLDHGKPFTACYGDLNHFKPFNDEYGYWRGDQMIRLLAEVLVSQCNARRDFVGHVGGDDFVILFQSEDWQQRVERMLGEFNARAALLYDDAARSFGGIEAEDRQGYLAFFPLTTLAVGAVRIQPGTYHRPEEVASAAALAKHAVKQRGVGLYIDESAGIGPAAA